jgi:hypothetical protein
MSRSPLEQLKALSVNRSNRTPVAHSEPAIDNEKAPEIAKSDIAFERLISAISVILTQDKPLIVGASLSKKHLMKFWEWVQRDVDRDTVSAINDVLGADKAPSEREIETQLNSLIELVEPIYEAALADNERRRRLSIQLGGPEVFDSLGTCLLVFKYIAFINSGFLLARELRRNAEVETFSYALDQAQFPSQEAKKLWCLAFIRGIPKAELLANALAQKFTTKTENAIRATNLGEYLDALVIEAQKQIETIEQQTGTFRDVDLICRSIDRFHHISRSLQFNLDLPKTTPWVRHLEDLIKRAAIALNGRFNDVVKDVNKVLRPAQGTDKTHLDPNDVLQAYNGLYILTATRAARESLAVNAVVERAWRDVGQGLEVMVDRIFEHYKVVAGTDPFATAQADVAIKFCSIRFGDEYAQVLKRNKLNIEQRVNRARSQA